MSNTYNDIPARDTASPLGGSEGGSRDAGLLVITPVKDSIESTEQTLRALAASELSVPHRFAVWNDRSTPESTARLAALCSLLGFSLVNIADLTDTPSPNYLFVLRQCQRECLESQCGLLIVESDVIVQPDTLQKMHDTALQHTDAGIVAAVTVDDAGRINYPYDFARKLPVGAVPTRRHCSFCCSLLTPELLRRYDFARLDPGKNWFDVTISHESLACGLQNILCTHLPVVHRPHQSRPWKQLKYKNPLLYYWRKFTKGFDKI